MLALDMPGRRDKPGDLREMTIADYVDSLVGDIESAGLDDPRELTAVMTQGILSRRHCKTMPTPSGPPRRSGPRPS